MILSELRDYLKQRQRVSLNDLILHFNVDAEALRGMLMQWIRKGKLKKITPSSHCGTSCCQCNPELTEIYEWLEK